MDPKTALKRYREQRRNASGRGIPWQLTFKQWVDFWGDDIGRRGVGRDKLCMQRYLDRGPYALGNIIKAVPSQNVRTMRNVRAAKLSQARAELLEAVLRAAEARPFERQDKWDGLTYDEMYVRKKHGYHSSLQVIAGGRKYKPLV